MKKIKFNLKLHVGVHIPLENCDKCIARCPNYGKNTADTNKKRMAIAEYIRNLNICPVYTYNSVPEMYDILNFNCAHPSGQGDADYTQNNSITIIDTNRKTGRLVVLSIVYEEETEWYDELQKDGKITYFYNQLKRRV